MGLNIKIDKDTKQKIYDEYEIAWNTRANIITTVQDVMDTLNSVITNPEIVNSFNKLKELNEEQMTRNNDLEEKNNNIDVNLEELFEADLSISKDIEVEEVK